MTQVRIKTCGIKTPDVAEYCAQQGAHYIGIVFCQQSPRYVNLSMAIDIAAAARSAGAIPMAVFTSSTAHEIMTICEKTHIDHVQLHGDIAKSSLQQLPRALHILFAYPLLENTIQSLHPGKDFVLFDAPHPGSGTSIDWTALQPPPGLRFFLAGGLNAQNVSQAIRIARPFAVDVSSGIESAPGIKCKERIRAFIQQAQEVTHD